MNWTFVEQLRQLIRRTVPNDGGLLFVLEAAPAIRIAHLHIVSSNGQAWQDYLVFRDLLRRDDEARDRHQRLKSALAKRFPNDRASYTTGKNDLVQELLSRDGAGNGVDS